MSTKTNFIDFLHDHYSNSTSSDVSATLAKLQQQLERQRKLVLNEIATVKREEEQLNALAQTNMAQPTQTFEHVDKKDFFESFDIDELNKLPLDL